MQGRSLLRRRGALAGALTGWLVLPAALIPAMAAEWEVGLASPVVSAAMVLAGAALIGLVIAAGLVGWATVPAGALVGYALARRRSDDTETLTAAIRRRL